MRSEAAIRAGGRPSAVSTWLGSGFAELHAEPVEAAAGFAVRLDNFEGPFDLLLGLISKHKLEVTELALHQVTDDFVAHIRAQGKEWDLDETTEFLVIAATLLDLKTARLLPSGVLNACGRRWPPTTGPGTRATPPP